jgi:hypothetical protein
MAVEFDFTKLRTALEESDARSLLALYADNATMKIVDRNLPSSSPMILEGKRKIEEFWVDVCSRQMTHKVTQEVLGSDRVFFLEECLYPDGCRVLSAMTLNVRGGLIVEHVTVQAWDEVSCAPS